MNIVFALVSMIVVYPILLVLPIRFNAKQKLIIVFISLFISMAGIISVNLFQLWQALIIMGVLAGVASILLSKRMPENEGQILMNHEDPIEDKDFINNGDLVNDDSNVDVIKERFRVQKELVEDNEMDEVDWMVQSESEFLENVTESIEQVETRVEESIESLYEELHSELFVAASLDSLEEINIEDKEPLVEDIKSIDTDNLSSLDYLSEIEKLLQEEEIDSLLEEANKGKPVVKVENDSSHIKEIKLEKLY
jgi:hypothetical protein